ncbi:sulfurtransferase complex subunit TusC [Parashewanella curva]|uniref:Sulfurtransferase complex subunit TusC n=1 Tax=Parashewanella curva TaxID=2338552 RepID=A0A3L8PW58_9GAMM|nr:sulfurtransferase complex subunit TusC [Parashewanella curva]RLV58668.1 sulfurtransferase complex subunit TusC [Parashewanella curva]
MKKLTVIFSSNPANNADGREGLDLTMLSASFDQNVTVIFVAQGVFNLLKHQQPEANGGKDYISTFKALPLYDVEDIFVCSDSLSELGLSSDDLIMDVANLNKSDIANLIDTADEVLVY